MRNYWVLFDGNIGMLVKSGKVVFQSESKFNFQQKTVHFSPHFPFFPKWAFHTEPFARLFQYFHNGRWISSLRYEYVDAMENSCVDLLDVTACLRIFIMLCEFFMQYKIALCNNMI